MIFLGHSPDKTGLVAIISSFFAENNLNILNLEEHTEHNRFFIRIEAEGISSSESVSNMFQPIADSISMEYSLYENHETTNIALFCSKTLHCPLELLSRQIAKTPGIDVKCIVSNARDAEEIAQQLHIPFLFTDTKKNIDYETQQLQFLKQFDIQLIALGRYMKIVSKNFLKECGLPIINIHHSFLPSFIGNSPYEMAYTRGVKIVGATAHFVTADLDEGPIIAQDVFPVTHSSSVKTMKQFGSDIEKIVFVRAIQKFSEHKIIEWKGRTVVFQ